VIWTVQNGFMDDVPVERVKDFQSHLTDYLTTFHADLLETIARERVLSEAAAAGLQTAATEFTRTWQ